MKILVNFEEKIQTEEKQRRYKFIANQFLRAREQSLTNRINIVELKQRLVLEEALTPKDNFRKSTKKRFRFDFSIKLTDPPVTVRPIRGRAYEFPDQTGPDTQICLTHQTESRLMFLNILTTKYGISILPPVYLHSIFEISSVTRIFFNFKISSLKN